MNTTASHRAPSTVPKTAHTSVRSTVRSAAAMFLTFAAVAVTSTTAAAVPDGDGPNLAPTQQTGVRPSVPVPRVVPAFDSSTGARACFAWRGTWNAAEGPQPTCSEPQSAVLARPAPVAKELCGTAPDVRFAGAPWVFPQATGCASIDRWWDFVPA
jgi:hypothetical protein